MQLWRMSYLREGAQRHVTFSAADLCQALEWADRWDAVHGDKLSEVSVTALPPSPFGARLVGGAESLK